MTEGVFMGVIITPSQSHFRKVNIYVAKNTQRKSDKLLGYPLINRRFRRHTTLHTRLDTTLHTTLHYNIRCTLHCTLRYTVYYTPLHTTLPITLHTRLHSLGFVIARKTFYINKFYNG